MATVGGNIVTASPISDLIPVFVAVNAKFVLKSKARGERVVPAREFFLGYRRTALQPDEVLVDVVVPFNKENQHVHAYQQCRRREDDIAIVTSCLQVTFKPGTTVVDSANLVFGGMGVTAVSASNTESFLEGKEWTSETIKEALKVMAGELRLDRDTPGKWRTTHEMDETPVQNF